MKYYKINTRKINNDNLAIKGAHSKINTGYSRRAKEE
jgi:hypothetical protein